MLFTITLNPAIDREYVVPAIEFDTVLRASGSHVDLGGKGFNVSRMVQSLGGHSTALGFIGGKSGEYLQEGLEALGIQTRFVWVPGETRTNIHIIPAGYHTYLKINEPGPEIPLSAQTELVDNVRSLAGPGQWWVLAGSLAPGVPENYYAVLIDTIHSAGGRTILDTSGAALAAGCRAGAYLVKPNEHEASKLTGIQITDQATAVEAAHKILTLGPKSIILSLGKAGAVFADAAATWYARSPEIVEGNPVGAGDSLVGGTVWALGQGLPGEEALRWGIACGAATASQPGTTVGTLSQVQDLLSHVQLNRLT